MFKKIIRDLQQYGGTRLVENAFGPPSQYPRILANSIPKSGTNLLSRSLYLSSMLRRKMQRTIYTCSLEGLQKKLSGVRNGEFVTAHLEYDIGCVGVLDVMGFKRILIIRDPRDIVLSNVDYITYGDKKHYLHRYYREHLTSDSERLSVTITGKRDKNVYVPGINVIIERYLGWLTDEGTLVVKFEDLVGPIGGGQPFQQLMAIENIYQHLGIEISRQEMTKISETLFSEVSKTFNKGIVGRWREVFEDEHIELFTEYCGSYLMELGYES